MAKIRISFLMCCTAGLLSSQVTSDRLSHADKEPQNWLTYLGSYAGIRYSPLSQVNRENVKDLQLKWVYRPSFTKTRNNQSKMENTPLVADGILFTGSALEAVALDAVTGRQFWRVPHPLDPNAYYNAYEVNKGMAIGGNTLFLGDGRLPPAGHRHENRQGDLGQGHGRLAQGIPIQCGSPGRKRHGDSRPGYERSGRQLLGRRLRRQDRRRTLALLYQSDLGRSARGEDMGGRFMEAWRVADLEWWCLRSGNEPNLLGHGESQSGLERRRAAAR